MAHDSSVLLQELHTLEPVVSEMLNHKDINEKLKEKILKLEEIIADISDDDEEQANEWRQNLAYLWKQYALLLDVPSVSVDHPVLIGRAPEESSESDTSLELKSYVLFRPGSTLRQMKPKKQLKLPTIFKMEKLFESLDSIKNMDDIQGMKQWLSIVVRTFWIVPPQLENERLQMEAYVLAIGKLPIEARELFVAQYEEESLYMLFDFVRLEVENYSENHRLQEPNVGYSGHEIAKLEKESRDADGNQIDGCKNCHEKEHTIKYCPTVKLSFCLSCFRYGHLDNVCYREPLFTRKPVRH